MMPAPWDCKPRRHVARSRRAVARGGCAVAKCAPYVAKRRETKGFVAASSPSADVPPGCLLFPPQSISLGQALNGIIADAPLAATA